MKKRFGLPRYDSTGEMILTTYDNDYSGMMMDIRVYRLKTGETRQFGRMGEESALLLLSGEVTFIWENGEKTVRRRNVFEDGPWCLHLCSGKTAKVLVRTEAELLVQCTHNGRFFVSRLYSPGDAPFHYSCRHKFGDTANRRVNTIFDYDTAPYSNMVLGEVLNDPGNWSGYLPHRHPQPETYFFKFDRPEGFGACFVGDQVFKSVNNSFAAIPGGELHPQAAAPGFRMYTCWMIRHLDANPWLQTDRHEDARYLWMHDAVFSASDFTAAEET